MKKTKQASVAAYSSNVIAERIAQARSGGREALNLSNCKVVAIDRAGEGEPSNTLVAVL